MVFWLQAKEAPAALDVSTLDEARAKGALVITERDQATVPELLVDNRGKSAVLMLAGEILIGGKAINGHGPDRGVVFQDFAQLFPWRTALGNVTFGLEMKGMGKGEREKIALDQLKLVKLEKFAGSYPHHLSGGMQQRVAIARALAYNPAVLLMDEPFAALDALTREELSLELQRIWGEERKTIVFVTHSIQEATLLADRIVVMSPRPGRVARILTVGADRPRSLGLTAHSDELDRVGAELHELLFAREPERSARG
jgi:NitT/TauT family transport system ATP-binding protein